MEQITAPQKQTIKTKKKNKKIPTKMTHNSVTLRIENIVVSVNFQQKIDLQKLLDTYKDIEEKDNFPGLVVKIKNPKATLLIFSSGKMVITGINLERHIPTILEIVINKLENAGISVEHDPISKVENIVVKGDFHKKINLDLTSIFLDRAIYEPEVFPGLILLFINNLRINQ